MSRLMIREELLHPVISHFPIALLVLVMFTKLAHLIVMKRYIELSKNIDMISKFLLIVGSIMILPALFLGDMAFDIVKNDLSNITTAYRHEDLAHNTLIVFIIAIVLDTLVSVREFSFKQMFTIQVCLFFTIALGNYYLFQTAHLGADLVYEQGAGVKRSQPKINQDQ
ncbi:MAG: putative membrane protein [Bacteriovoracaceae bacterium]|jgi:uncharacterized membrane protein